MNDDKTGGPAWPIGWSVSEAGGEYIVQKPGIGGVVVKRPNLADEGQSIAEAMLYYILRDTHDAMLAERAKREKGDGRA